MITIFENDGFEAQATDRNNAFMKIQTCLNTQPTSGGWNIDVFKQKMHNANPTIFTDNVLITSFTRKKTEKFIDETVWKRHQKRIKILFGGQVIITW